MRKRLFSKVGGILSRDVDRAAELFAEDRRLKALIDPSPERQKAQEVAERMYRDGIIPDPKGYADYIMERLLSSAQKGLPNAAGAAQFAGRAREVGLAPAAEWDKGGSAYVMLSQPNFTKSGSINKRTPETPVKISDSQFKARFADHAPYYRTTVSVDPVTGNTVDDAIALMEWVKGGRIGPHPQIRDGYIVPGSGTNITAGYKKFWAVPGLLGLGALQPADEEPR